MARRPPGLGRRIGRAVLEAFKQVHRWIGVLTCLVFAVWFVSGLVMAYVPFPSYGEAERLERLPPLDWTQVKVAPQAVLQSEGLNRFPRELRLEMMSGRPVYRINAGLRPTAVSAVDGRRIETVDADAAVAAVKAMVPSSRPSLMRTLDVDQWTVSSGLNSVRPLHKVALNDRSGTELYVASRTGEVVMATTRRERLWNYVGSVPHWIYFTGLRINGPLWTDVVLWVSGIGMASAVSGVVMGIARISLRRKYIDGKMTPWRGWMGWHHWVGLVGGVFVCTWVFSGWLSMNPNGWLADQGSPGDRDAYAGVTEPRFDLDLSRTTSRAAAAPVARFVWLHGKPMVVLSDRLSGRTLFDGVEGQVVTPDPAWLAEGAKALYPGAKLVKLETLTRDDDYWYGPGRQLPVMRASFDDPEKTWVHIDPQSGTIVGALNRDGRTWRWAFTALHDLDVAILFRNRPAWDLVVWALSLLGLATSVTGVVIGWRRLAKTFAVRRKRVSAVGKVEAV